MTTDDRLAVIEAEIKSLRTLVEAITAGGSYFGVGPDGKVFAFKMVPA